MEFRSGFEILTIAANCEGLARVEDVLGAPIEVIFKAIRRFQKKEGQVEYEWDSSQTKARRLLMDEILEGKLTENHVVFQKSGLWGVSEALQGGNLLSVSAKKRDCYKVKSKSSSATNKKTAERTISCSNDIMKMLNDMRNENKVEANKIQDEFLKVNKQLECVATMDYVNTNISELNEKIKNLSAVIKTEKNTTDQQIADKLASFDLTDELVQNATTKILENVSNCTVGDSTELRELKKQLESQEERLNDCISLLEEQSTNSLTSVPEMLSTNKIRQEYNLHECQKSVFMNALRGSRTSGSLKCVLLSDKFFTVQEDGYIKIHTNEIDYVLNSSTYVKECYRNGNNNVICKIGLDRNIMNRGRVISEIMMARKELMEKFKIAVSVATPREYDISPTLLIWEKQGLIAKRDTTRSGLLKVWINNGVANENRSEFLQNCTLLTILNPLKLILIQPTIPILKELAEGTKFVGQGGRILETPADLVEKEKTRAPEEKTNEASNIQQQNRSRPATHRRSYDRRLQNQNNFSTQNQPNKYPRVPQSKFGKNNHKTDQQLATQTTQNHEIATLNNSFSANKQQNSPEQQVQIQQSRAPFIAPSNNGQVHTNAQNYGQAVGTYNPYMPTRYIPEIDYENIDPATRYYNPKKGGSSKPTITIVDNSRPVQQDFVYDQLPDHHTQTSQRNQQYQHHSQQASY